MPPIHSFSPIEGPNARLLILGSMPSKTSLLVRQYYAHNRNSFWPIMDDLITATRTLPYTMRINILKSNGIALWDVLASCARAASILILIKLLRVQIISNYFFLPIQILQIFFSTVQWLRNALISLCCTSLNLI